MSFKQKYTFEERIQKFKKQIYQQDPGKILIIAQKHPKSNLPDISSKFLCEKHYKFNMIKNRLSQIINQKIGKQKQTQQKQLFCYVGNKIIKDQEQNMQQIYNKHKDEDGFLYIQYGRQEDFKKFIHKPYFPIVVTIVGVFIFATIRTLINNQPIQNSL